MYDASGADWQKCKETFNRKTGSSFLQGLRLTKLSYCGLLLQVDFFQIERPQVRTRRPCDTNFYLSRWFVDLTNEIVDTNDHTGQTKIFKS